MKLNKTQRMLGFTLYCKAEVSNNPTYDSVIFKENCYDKPMEWAMPTLPTAKLC